jgi:uncharacterized protein
MQQHTLNWFEIPVADLARATQFYETLSGKPLRLESYGLEGEQMAVFAADKTAVTGALIHSPRFAPAAQGSVVYLNASPRIDDWLARVVAAGGQVLQSKTALPPGAGYYALLTDSEGNRVGLHAME